MFEHRLNPLLEPAASVATPNGLCAPGGSFVVGTWTAQDVHALMSGKSPRLFDDGVLNDAVRAELLAAITSRDERRVDPGIAGAAGFTFNGGEKGGERDAICSSETTAFPVFRQSVNSKAIAAMVAKMAVASNAHRRPFGIDPKNDAAPIPKDESLTKDAAAQLRAFWDSVAKSDPPQIIVDTAFDPPQIIAATAEISPEAWDRLRGKTQPDSTERVAAMRAQSLIERRRARLSEPVGRGYGMAWVAKLWLDKLIDVEACDDLIDMLHVLPPASLASARPEISTAGALRYRIETEHGLVFAATIAEYTAALADLAASKPRNIRATAALSRAFALPDPDDRMGAAAFMAREG
jgi:hypothetical protein